MFNSGSNAYIFEITGSLDIDMDARKWCLLSYPGHPNGCPNYGKSEYCPPKVPIITKAFNLAKPHWFIAIEFNLETHAQFMKAKHPQWSDKQCRCLLYWQGTVKKELRILAQSFIQQEKEYSYSLIPEAMGVNVFTTANKHGLKLQRNPKSLVYKIAFLGVSP